MFTEVSLDDHICSRESGLAICQARLLLAIFIFNDVLDGKSRFTAVAGDLGGDA